MIWDFIITFMYKLHFVQKNDAFITCHEKSVCLLLCYPSKLSWCRKHDIDFLDVFLFKSHLYHLTIKLSAHLNNNCIFQGYPFFSYQYSTYSIYFFPFFIMYFYYHHYYWNTNNNNNIYHNNDNSNSIIIICVIFL